MWGDLGLGELPKFLCSPIIFLQRMGLATANLTRLWGLPRTIIKSHAEERVGVAWARKAPQTSIFTQWLKLATSNLVHSFGLPRPTIKPHPEEKWAWPWVREASIYLGFPFNISATAALLALAELFVEKQHMQRCDAFACKKNCTLISLNLNICSSNTWQIGL